MVSAEADVDLKIMFLELTLYVLYIYKIVMIRSRMEALLFAHPILVSKIQELQRGHLRDSRLNCVHLCFMIEGML